MYKRLKPALILAVWLVAAVHAHAAPDGVEHLVIVGIDGMGTTGVTNGDIPVMRKMMSEGAWTMHARGVIPTVSMPNWAAIIMGAGPEQNGVTTNDWKPEKTRITPACTGLAKTFPTIFGVLREQKPDANMAIFHDWSEFNILVEPGVPNVIEHTKGPETTINRAIEYFKQNRPLFMFIHLDNVDHAGHTEGWETPPYMQALNLADTLIGKLRDAIEEAAGANKTIYLVTSDHGGTGKNHGMSLMNELEIPWMISGPGVVKGKELNTPINNFDTAATAAWILGVNPPECWIGRPVRAAFEPVSKNP